MGLVVVQDRQIRRVHVAVAIEVGTEIAATDFRVGECRIGGIDEQIAEGEKVVTRLTAIGKHEGDLPGAPRTGNALTMTAITIHRIANGKLVEKWSEKDVLGFLTQIGVMRPPGQQGS